MWPRNKLNTIQFSQFYLAPVSHTEKKGIAAVGPSQEKLKELHDTIKKIEEPCDDLHTKSSCDTTHQT
jgi:hypothetical protein